MSVACRQLCVTLLVRMGVLALVTAGCTPRPTVGGATAPLDPAAPDTGSVTLHWERRGEGSDLPPVLVFHGGPGAPDAAPDALPFWRALAARTALVTFDQRGAGRSGRLTGRAAPPDRAHHYRLVRLADDAEAVRRAALPEDRAVVALGVSAGAQLALLYALRHPASVRALVLVEPAPDHRWVSAAGAHLAAFLDRLAAADPTGRVARGVARLRDGAPACPELLPEVLLFGVVGRQGYTRAGQERLAAALAALGHGDPAELCALAPKAGPLATALRSEALFRTVACAELGWAAVSPANCAGVPEAERLDLSEDLARVKVPVLILSSRNDPIIPAHLHDEVADALGGPVTLVPFEESGHLPLQEEPETSLNAVLTFLEKLSGE